MRVSRHVTLTWCGPSKVLLTTSMTGQGRGPKETISEVALARQECTKASACMSIESDRGGGGMGSEGVKISIHRHRGATCTLVRVC